MLVSVLPVPFADVAHQRQYEAVLAALHAEADAPATVLLGNLGAFSPVVVDILLVRPTGLALVVLTPAAGQLTMDALTHGPWQLDGQPLASPAAGANPFVQYQQQGPGALAWLSEHLGLPEAELPPCVGIALFDAPLRFGPGVEAQLHRYAAATDFQLVGGAEQLPARLRQLPLAAELAALNEDELLDWGDYLASEPHVAHAQGVPESLFEDLDLPSYLGQKLRQLWSWLGAEDIPTDPPYGGAPPLPDPALRDQQEQARLHQLRQELLAELQQQRQEAATREATRTQELAQLRQQLAQAGQSAAERQAEQAAKAALEESLRTARTELATRNQELDARIGQLGQLIEQLHKPGPAAIPTKPVSLSAPAPRPASSRPAPPKTVYRRLHQAERWGIVALAVGILGAGGFGLTRWLHHPKNQSLTTAPRRSAQAYQPAEEPAPAPVIVYDTLATTPAEGDLGATRAASTTTEETAPTPALITPNTPLHVDSAALITEPAHLSAPPDSAATSPAP